MRVWGAAFLVVCSSQPAHAQDADGVETATTTIPGWVGFDETFERYPQLGVSGAVTDAEGSRLTPRDGTGEGRLLVKVWPGPPGVPATLELHARDIYEAGTYDGQVTYLLGAQKKKRTHRVVVFAQKGPKLTPGQTIEVSVDRCTLCPLTRWLGREPRHVARVLEVEGQQKTAWARLLAGKTLHAWVKPIKGELDDTSLGWPTVTFHESQAFLHVTPAPRFLALGDHLAEVGAMLPNGLKADGNVTMKVTVHRSAEDVFAWLIFGALICGLLAWPLEREVRIALHVKQAVEYIRHLLKDSSDDRGALEARVKDLLKTELDYFQQVRGLAQLMLVAAVIRDVQLLVKTATDDFKKRLEERIVVLRFATVHHALSELEVMREMILAEERKALGEQKETLRLSRRALDSLYRRLAGLEAGLWRRLEVSPLLIVIGVASVAMTALLVELGWNFLSSVGVSTAGLALLGGLAWSPRLLALGGLMLWHWLHRDA